MITKLDVTFCCGPTMQTLLEILSSPKGPATTLECLKIDWSPQLAQTLVNLHFPLLEELELFRACYVLKDPFPKHSLRKLTKFLSTLRNLKALETTNIRYDYSGTQSCLNLIHLCAYGGWSSYDRMAPLFSSCKESLKSLKLDLNTFRFRRDCTRFIQYFPRIYSR
jgi:hypothetical protein